MQAARYTGPYCGGPSLGPLQGDEGARRLLIFGGKLSVQRLRKRFPAARAHTVWCIGCSGSAEEDGAASGGAEPITLLQGSPSATESVASWASRLANGSFDAVVDAGHRIATGGGPVGALLEKSAMERLRELWPLVSDGGRYYVDAIHPSEQASASATLTAWMEQLVLFQHPKVRVYRKKAGWAAATARVAKQPKLPSATSFVVAGPQSAIVSKVAAQPGSVNEVAFRTAAFAASPKQVTDKVLGGMDGHSYQRMYGALLMPMRNASTPGPRKMLEVGLGCGMRYGAGASAYLWQYLLPEAEKWEAEFDKACVKNAIENKLLGDIHAVTGSSSNRTEVQGWVSESGGGFDVVIDDSGHSNRMVMTDLDELWPALLPGGVYFMEDLHVAHTERYDDTDGKDVSTDFLRALASYLLGSGAQNHSQAALDAAARAPGAAYVLCQEMACAIGRTCDASRDAVGDTQDVAG